MPSFLPDIQLKKGQITDLTYTDFAEVTYGTTFKEYLAISTFPEMEERLRRAASQASIKHIRVNFPSNWEDFDAFLEQNGYDLGLYHIQNFQYPPGSFVRSLQQIHDIRVVLPLLHAQQELHHRLNSVFFQKPDVFDADMYLKDIQKTLDADQGAAYGFFEGDRLAGFVSTEIQGNSLYIVELYVDPTFRGRSLGRMLMQAAFHYARLKNCASVMTSLAVQNEGAVAFYDKLGFVREWTTRYKNV